jgi:transcription antitermination factor NusG
MHRWHVLFTKPRCERRVGEVLAGRGIDVFVPLVFYHGKHGNMLDKPLFPRYMFAHLDWQATGVKEVRWTPGAHEGGHVPGRAGGDA